MEEFASYGHTKPQKPEMSPIWRGVGCILMVVIPLVSYALTAAIVPSLVTAGWVPQELLGHIQFSAWVYTAPTLGAIAEYLSSVDYLWVKLIVFFIVLSLLSGILSFLYSILYQLFGPPRYTELDAPPAKYKPKVYKR